MHKIDLHTHILPPALPDMRRLTGYGGWISYEEAGPGCKRMMPDVKLFRVFTSAAKDKTSVEIRR